jgi:hypothetical protein
MADSASSLLPSIRPQAAVSIPWAPSGWRASFLTSLQSGTPHAGLGTIGRGTITFGDANGPGLDLGMAALAVRDAGGRTIRGMRTSARMRWGEPGRTFWIGSSFERLPAEGPASPPLLAFGVSGDRGPLHLAASLERTMQPVHLEEQSWVRQDSSLQLITTRRDDVVPTTAARLDLRGERGRWSAETVAGLTLARGRVQRWMQVALSATLSPLLAVEGVVGETPPRWLALDAAPERRASLGLRVTPPLPGVRRDESIGATPPAWSTVRATGGRFLFRLTAPGARRVEIAGDWTGWSPVAMRRVSGTRWEITATLAPGVHQLNVRYDGGAWAPPPGMPTRADGFNGSVGVLAVE